jgi:uncharacterized protein (TIGR00369 family)
MSDDDLPPSPIRQMLGLRLLEHRAGFIRLAYRQVPSHYNGSGLLHGGILMMLLDEAAGMAGFIRPDGSRQRSVTVELSAHLTGGAEDPEIEVTGQVLRSGRRLYFSHAEVRDARGNLLAFSASTHRYSGER